MLLGQRALDSDQRGPGSDRRRLQGRHMPAHQAERRRGWRGRRSGGECRGGAWRGQEDQGGEAEGQGQRGRHRGHRKPEPRWEPCAPEQREAGAGEEQGRDSECEGGLDDRDGSGRARPAQRGGRWRVVAGCGEGGREVQQVGALTADRVL